MNKPVLVVMAAGMGSRYGGMKQIDPVGPNGEVIIDYSLYDAYRAGFRTVIFVIKHEIEEAFRAAIGDRISKIMEVKYAFQQLDILPTGFEVPENREKPWGTCHAVLAAKNLIDGPFAVINADDYYGVEAFQVMYDYLSTHADDDFYRYCMVSYLLKNTLSENGSVARGVCIKNEDGTLQSVTERTRIFANKSNLRPIGVGLYQTVTSMMNSGDWAGMFASVVIVFIPTVVIYAFLSDKIISGVTAGGNKG